ncbi:S41 family peptidase [Paenibacillus filicis]|uniref:S41 family peptidase n=1 Tax=Paenibacillus gyeongsangnamensis TaxID=3388067 RepID=A0ABT4Q8D9_9BACL|nr:S41 family peptidase [Paenibacillus filicis]MCZ8513089.1 S41 family peptidase [Paenibacillus filicis]
MKRKKLRPIWRKTVSAALALTLLLPVSAPAWAADTAAAPAGSMASDRVKEVLDLLEKNHVSAPSADKLSDTAIKAMLGTLKDPYTDYFTDEELKQFTSSIENQYVGIGVRIMYQEDGVYIAEVFDGSGAKEAGIQPGDLIVAVGGESVAGQKLDAVTPKILGKPDTTVDLTIRRDGVDKPLTVKRTKVQIPTVVRKLFQPGIGYLKVTSFSSDAGALTSLELSALKAQGIKSLIVDLRDNPGGLLDSALSIAKLFVKEGVLIHTNNRNNVDEPVSFSGGTTQNIPVYFLVNENSASASEVLTGALQDYGAIKVIGTKTFGKGSVQNLFPLKSGGAIKITIEEYLTPKLRKVNKVGLEPDVKVDGAVPQLIEALRLAGADHFDVTLDRRNVSVNGQSVQDLFELVRQNGHTLAPARLLGELVGGQVVWNESSRTVQIVSKDGAVTYTPSGDAFLLKDGTSYVDLASFQQTFAQLSWTDDGTKATLSVGS